MYLTKVMFNLHILSSMLNICVEVIFEINCTRAILTCYRIGEIGCSFFIVFRKKFVLRVCENNGEDKLVATQPLTFNHVFLSTSFLAFRSCTSHSTAAARRRWSRRRRRTTTRSGTRSRSRAPRDTASSPWTRTWSAPPAPSAEHPPHSLPHTTTAVCGPWLHRSVAILRWASPYLASLLSPLQDKSLPRSFSLHDFGSVHDR